MYHAWLVHVRPLVATSTTVSIILMSFLVLRFYLKTWLADPGFVASPQEGRAAAVIRTIEEKGGLPQVSNNQSTFGIFSIFQGLFLLLVHDAEA